MKLREALMAASEILRSSGIDGAEFDAQVLIQYILNKDRTFLIREPSYMLSADEKNEYFKGINERALGKPVSYITGTKEFMGLPFKVSEEVLIPRPDTEILVETGIAILKEKLNELYDGNDLFKGSRDICNTKLKVMDLCTGSGAIAVSLAAYVPECYVFASDISMEALKIARENSVTNGVDDRISFCQGDLFEAFGDGCEFDLIVSNPPYIPKHVIKELMRDVRDFEPVLALDGGQDGLDFYRRIIPEAAFRLKVGGNLLLEIGHDQSKAISDILKQCNAFSRIRIIKDLAGLDRVITAIKEL